jgi:nitronate monooxygenase
MRDAGFVVEFVAVRTRFTDLLGIELPIIQAPMAGSNGSALVIAVAEAGALGSLPCVMLTPDLVRAEVEAIRTATERPFGLNFFCHRHPVADPVVMHAWLDRLAPYFEELGIERPESGHGGMARMPFGGEHCSLVEELRPPVVSFHFGLPDPGLLDRVKATGATVLSSATSASEAVWLEAHGCDVVIAQGAEAGGHRGMFLADDPAMQVGTMALVPAVVDAVDVPVIAAGGIGDGRGVAAALALGAHGVQMGTAFLRCPEASTSPVHRAALAAASGDQTVLTNVLTGRPARSVTNRLIREVGPMSGDAPPFPLAAVGSGLLRGAAEPTGSAEFSPLWSGQAVALGRDVPAGDLVREVADNAADVLRAAAATMHR